MAEKLCEMAGNSGGGVTFSTYDLLYTSPNTPGGTALQDDINIDASDYNLLLGVLMLNNGELYSTFIPNMNGEKNISYSADSSTILTGGITITNKVITHYSVKGHIGSSYNCGIRVYGVK